MKIMKRQPGMHKLMASKSPILALTHIISHQSIFWLMLQKKSSLTRQHYFQCEKTWATDAFFVETEDASYLELVHFLIQDGFTQAIIPIWTQLRVGQNKIFKSKNILNSQYSQGFWHTGFMLPLPTGFALLSAQHSAFATRTLQRKWQTQAAEHIWVASKMALNCLWFILKY